MLKIVFDENKNFLRQQWTVVYDSKTVSFFVYQVQKQNFLSAFSKFRYLLRIKINLKYLRWLYFLQTSLLY